ncbi:MAG: polysaccharide biosynthesis/export family protein [Sphingomonadaceae bacterium]
MASVITLSSPNIAKVAAIMLAGAGLTGCTTANLQGLPSMSATQQDEYRVNSGDKIRIAIQDIETADGEYTVDGSGAISLPLVKDIKVRGLTYRQIEDGIETAYLNAGILTSPIVNVQPVHLRTFYIMGEVNRPGEFDYREGMTVFGALSAAGGYTYRARTGEVALTRSVDGQDVTSRGTENTLVLPGDRIRVYERWF